jgi:phage shock protein PspC (stress-responsive transcriptional regulator)
MPLGRGAGARLALIRWWQRSPAADLDWVLVLTLGSLVFAVHDVHYVLSAPYWVDESWVAVTSSYPLSQLPATTSSTPIGWSLLLRVFSWFGDQTGRLLPLGFAALAVMCAYWLIRGLGWRHRDTAIVAGVLGGTATLIDPAMLARDDLKQYTADACLALLIIALLAALEREWTRRGLLALSTSVWAGMLLSHTSAFVGAAAFGSLVLVQAVRRQWSRVIIATATGAGTAVAMGAVYLLFDARGVSKGLTSYWTHYYLPVDRGWPAMWKFLQGRLHGTYQLLGLGPGWMAFGLFVLGAVAMVLLGRPATAATVVLLWPEMLLVSALKKYPFLDPRTSTFLFVVTAVVAAAGAALIVSVIRHQIDPPAAVTMAAIAMASYLGQNSPGLRSHPIPNENARSQSRYLDRHAGPEDVILVNLSASWAFAYYWPHGRPGRRASTSVLQGYTAYFPDQPRIVVADGRDIAGVRTSFELARAQTQGHPGSRIWLVRMHAIRPEIAALHRVLTEENYHVQDIDQDGLGLVEKD